MKVRNFIKEVFLFTGVAGGVVILIDWLTDIPPIDTFIAMVMILIVSDRFLR